MLKLSFLFLFFSACGSQRSLPGPQRSAGPEERKIVFMASDEQAAHQLQVIIGTFYTPVHTEITRMPLGGLVLHYTFHVYSRKSFGQMMEQLAEINVTVNL